MATLAGRLGRFWWAADLLAHFAVYLALAGAGLCLATLLFRRWVLTALALLVLMVNGVLVWPVLMPKAQSARPGVSALTLALINVEHKNRDRVRVGAYIKGCDADLIIVQEVDPWWDRVLHEMDIPYSIALSQPGEGSFGIALLVHDTIDDDPAFMLLDKRVIDFAEGFDGAERPAVQATLLLDGRRVRLLGIHPPPPVSADRTLLRDSVLRRAKQWADEQTDPHIVIGDLNTTPWSYAFSILTDDSQLISTQDGLGNQGTWPTRLPLMPWLLPIDHCLISEGLVCVDRRIGTATGSDHRPLLVGLALPPADVSVKVLAGGATSDLP
jgi:endonuclease/exonuclease/phosphatase (EEP) superfamily protein YafD